MFVIILLAEGILMEEVQFLNTKEFTYHIEIDDVITKIYDEKIKEILNKINSIKEDIDLLKIKTIIIL